jgi:hypothetical protein
MHHETHRMLSPTQAPLAAARGFRGNSGAAGLKYIKCGIYPRLRVRWRMKLLASLGTSSFSSDWGCEVTRQTFQGRHGCDWSATRGSINFGAGAGPTQNVYLKPIRTPIRSIKILLRCTPLLQSSTYYQVSSKYH